MWTPLPQNTQYPSPILAPGIRVDEVNLLLSYKVKRLVKVHGKGLETDFVVGPNSLIEVRAERWAEPEASGPTDMRSS